MEVRESTDKIKNHFERIVVIFAVLFNTYFSQKRRNLEIDKIYD